MVSALQVHLSISSYNIIGTTGAGHAVVLGMVLGIALGVCL